MNFFKQSSLLKIAYWYDTYLYVNFQSNRACRYIRRSSDVAIDVFQYKYQVFPIFEINHWFLAIAEFSDEKSNGTSCPEEIFVYIFDSLPDSNGRKEKCYKVLKSFYLKTILQVYGKAQQLIFLRDDHEYLAEKQNNGFDCGAFVLYHIHTFFNNCSTLFTVVSPPDIDEDIGLFYRRYLFQTPRTIFDIENTSLEESFLENRKYLGTIELDDFQNTPESITKTFTDIDKANFIEISQNSSHNCNDNESSYLSIDQAKTMNMDQHGCKESSFKENVFDKICSGSIDSDSFNYYNDDNYHGCEIETVEHNRVDLEKIQEQIFENSTLKFGAKKKIPVRIPQKVAKNKISMYEQRKMAYSSSEYVNDLENISLKHLNFNMKAGVYAILSLPSDFNKSSCVTLNQLANDHVNHMKRKRDINFKTNWINFINELRDKQFIFVRFDHKLILNSDMLLLETLIEPDIFEDSRAGKLIKILNFIVFYMIYL